MRGLIAALCLLASTSAWAAIGTVSEHKGSACGIERNKQKMDGTKGATVESMDIYTTGNCVGSITFKDDTKVKINENSRLLIDDFVFDPKASDAGKLAMKVGAGTVRYASGQIAKNNPQQVNIKTPTAAIAVRGTDFTMTVDETGQSLVVLLPSCKDDKDVKKYELEENKCRVGKIDVSTLNGMVTLDKAFEGTFVTSATLPPTAPRVLNIVESKIGNGLIISRPPEIQKAVTDQNRTDGERDRDNINNEAMGRSNTAQPSQVEIADRIRAMQRASLESGCNPSPNVCVTWDKPDAIDLAGRGRGIAYRTNIDNYAEVKTTGADSNTFVSITHNDSYSSFMIGDSGAVSNTITIKQNVGIYRTR